MQLRKLQLSVNLPGQGTASFGQSCSLCFSVKMNGIAKHYLCAIDTAGNNSTCCVIVVVFVFAAPLTITVTQISTIATAADRVDNKHMIDTVRQSTLKCV
jgi:hypothetical protein